MIYLDSAATTRISDTVLEGMMPFLTYEYGNAGTIHGKGVIAKDAINKARERVSKMFNCNSEQVIFTSGGSESNSMVFAGLKERLKNGGKRHIIVSSIEHHSVLNAALALRDDGFSVSIINPDHNGYISAKAVEDEIRHETGLVSIMYANNEIGTINDIEKIGELCKSKDILFHVDCVQAAGQYEIDVGKCHIDYASISGHKFHAPKGIGALYVGDKNIKPLIHGGKTQEFSLRGGTENVANIVGLGIASEFSLEYIDFYASRIKEIKQRFYNALCDELDALGVGRDVLRVNGMPVSEAGKVLNIRIDSVDSETLVLLMSSKGVCISSGSACNSHESSPSHVLLAIGLSPEEARSSIRVSFSKYNTMVETEEAARIMANGIHGLLGLQNAE